LPLVSDIAGQQYTQGNAEPDGPISRTTLHTGKGTSFELPPASIVVLRGRISEQ
jgi:hypothetical protein